MWPYELKSENKWLIIDGWGSPPETGLGGGTRSHRAVPAPPNRYWTGDGWDRYQRKAKRFPTKEDAQAEIDTKRDDMKNAM